MKIIFFISLFGFLGFPQQSEHQLTIKFNGIQLNEGQVLVKIVDKDGKEIAGHKLVVQNKKAQLTAELPAGSYAISAFHDVNNDNKLNTNPVGLPTEIYGFSNDARGWFGPPDLEDQLVEIKQNTSINITLK